MNHALSLLIVEDNVGDAELIQDTLTESKFKINVAHLDDGEKALAYVMRQQPYQTVNVPDLILLDLNLPKLNGREVLKELRYHEYLKSIPVVVLTSSDAKQDIYNCYELGANCYVTKPSSLTQFQATVISIASFWFNVARLP